MNNEQESILQHKNGDHTRSYIVFLMSVLMSSAWNEWKPYNPQIHANPYLRPAREGFLGRCFSQIIQTFIWLIWKSPQGQPLWGQPLWENGQALSKPGAKSSKTTSAWTYF